MVSVSRVQSLQLWTSYVAKRHSVRTSSNPNAPISNPKPSPDPNPNPDPNPDRISLTLTQTLSINQP